MAAEANPTLDQLITEGLAKAGERSPSSTLMDRARTRWVSEIRNDLFKDIKQPKFLQITSHGILVRGQSRYSMPTDYSNDLTMTLLDGTLTGVARAGSLSTIQLAAGTLAESDVIGKPILVTTGIGKASISQVISLDVATQTATVAPSFAASPDVGSNYLVVDREDPLDGNAVWDNDRGKTHLIAKPCKFFTTGDDSSGEFELDSAPDKVYGVRLRYYANIMKLDATSAMMSNLYSRWENMWIKGFTAKHLGDNDDDRAANANTDYLNEAQAILASEGYGVDIHNLRQTVTDYC